MNAETRKSLETLAGTLNAARLLANNIKEAEAQDGVYGQTVTALKSALALLLDGDEKLVEFAYGALLDGLLVEQALALAYRERTPDAPALSERQERIKARAERYCPNLKIEVFEERGAVYLQLSNPERFYAGKLTVCSSVSEYTKKTRHFATHSAYGKTIPLNRVAMYMDEIAR